MNPIFQQVIAQTIRFRNKNKDKKAYTPQDLEKEIKRTSIDLKYFFRDALFILLGILSAAFGLKSFLLPNSFIDGGVVGISLIANELTAISLSVLLVVINLPFILLGFQTVSKSFAFKSIFSIGLLALAVHFLEFPIITNDKLLIAVFGGFFLGLGIGLTIRGGAVIDGTEVLAVYISKKLNVSIGDVIFVLNVLIFGVSAYIFSIEIALYAMLTYLSASKTVDYVISGIEEYLGVTIISDYSEHIRLAIINELGRGCTLYDGYKGYTKNGDKLESTKIVYTLLTRLELSKLHNEIDKIDEDAFMVMHSIKDVRGGMIKKRPLK